MTKKPFKSTASVAEKVKSGSEMPARPQFVGWWILPSAVCGGVIWYFIIKALLSALG
jgi:hypothetical protein